MGRLARVGVVAAWVGMVGVVGCRSVGAETDPRAGVTATATAAASTTVTRVVSSATSVGSTATEIAPTTAPATAPVTTTEAPSPTTAITEGPSLLPSVRDIGPYELPFLPKRSAYLIVPSSTARPHPLIANLHGLCNPPSYACGYWSHAASQVGFLVCPAGNSSCGPGAYDAPTWTESYAQMGQDLDAAIRKVEQEYPGEISEDDGVLTGFSMGAYAAPIVAARHPGRWRYLILNEADVTLSAESLRRSGVRAVALIAGERGSQLAGERKTCDALLKSGFPAKLWVMPKAGHYYSANIDDIMGEALAFVMSNKPEEPAAVTAR